MFKAPTPIIGILVAIGLFFSYVRPTFEEIKGIQSETAEYAQAVEKASALQARINELKARQSSIPLADLERLEAFLPDRVDEVAALIDLDALAGKHRLVLGDITVGDDEGKSTPGQAGNSPAATPRQTPATPAPGPATTQAAAAMPVSGADFLQPGAGTPSEEYSALEIGFSVTGTYDDFRMFLDEIERSLVLMEVSKISFTTGDEGDAGQFTMTVRLYALNEPAS